ncbi:hypothetical protein JCM3766R1_005970 [Sporobolomyces carnicolor]
MTTDLGTRGGRRTLSSRRTSSSSSLRPRLPRIQELDVPTTTTVPRVAAASSGAHGSSFVTRPASDVASLGVQTTVMPSQQFPPRLATPRPSSNPRFKSSQQIAPPRRGCGVCAAIETGEWRRGPAGVRSLCNACGLVAARRARNRHLKGISPPRSVSLILRELEAIGLERFKSRGGRYMLPPGSRERLEQLQARDHVRPDSDERAGSTALGPTRSTRAYPYPLEGSRRSGLRHRRRQIPDHSVASPKSTLNRDATRQFFEGTETNATNVLPPSWTYLSDLRRRLVTRVGCGYYKEDDKGFALMTASRLDGAIYPDSNEPALSSSLDQNGNNLLSFLPPLS